MTEFTKKIMCNTSYYSSGDVYCMWNGTTNCIREATREVLGSRRMILVDREAIGGRMLRSRGK